MVEAWTRRAVWVLLIVGELAFTAAAITVSAKEGMWSLPAIIIDVVAVAYDAFCLVFVWRDERVRAVLKKEVWAFFVKDLH